MNINNKAIGITLKGSDFEYVKAIRKPNSDCKISQEVWFSGKARAFQTKKEGGKDE